MSFLDAVQFPMVAATAASTPTASGSASGSGATNGTSNSGATGNSTLSTNEINQLANPQLFLQLLVAELQNQDPTSPMNPSTILSQTANLSQMEAVNTMTSAIASEQQATQTSEATGLIGQTITATVNKSTVTGKVTDIQLNSSGAPTLVVNGTTVPLSDVTEVGTSTSAGAASPASTGTGSGS